MLERYNLSDKVAVITGGAGLLGKQHANALLACGANVVLTDINTEQLAKVVQALGKEYKTNQLTTQVMDVTKKISIEEAFKTILSRFGKIDILINNAALDPKVTAKEDMVNTSRFEHFSLAEWQLQLDVGLTGAMLCSQVFGNWMAANHGGVIVNIASDLSVIAPDQRLYSIVGKPEEQQSVKPVSYSVIKTGLIGLTRYLAAYWASKNIRVNALSPGGVYTNQSDEFVTRLSGLIPMQRMADKHEYEAAIQFLCSDASSYMTGQNIVMDGGRSIL